MSIIDKLWFSLQVAGVGMGIVFLGLIILILIITILGKILGQKKRETSPAPAPVAPAAPVAAPAVEPGTDPEVVAVITAALMAYDAARQDQGKALVVRSIRRTGSAWGRAGRQEQIYSHY